MYKVTINGEVLKQTVETIKVELLRAFVIALEETSCDQPQLLHTPIDDDGDWEFGPQDDARVAWHLSYREAEIAMGSMELEDCHVTETSVVVLQLDHKPKLGWYVYTDDRTGDSWPVKVARWDHDEENGWMASDGVEPVSYFEEDLKPWKA